MKIKITLFLLLYCVSTYSQSKRFYYNLTMKIDSVNEIKDLTVLEINDTQNLFFSNEYLHVDSLNNKTNKFIFPYPKYSDIIIWNLNNNSFDIKKKLSMNYYQYNTTKNINWNLTQEKKKIGDYNVQKATSNYGGRNWIAWFTNEINLPYGPYLFYGLPGLILEIYDTENNFHFSFVKNKNYSQNLNTEKIFEKYLGKTKFQIKESDWKQIQLNYYNNPIPEYISGKAMILKNDKTEYTINDYRTLEKDIKNNIKKYNNPIELSEKINYK